MTERTCETDGCERKHAAKGMCHYHWRKANPPKKDKAVACPQCGDVTMRRDAGRGDVKVATGFCSLICRDLWRIETGNNPSPKNEKRVSRLPTDHPVRALIREQGIARGRDKVKMGRSQLLAAIEVEDWTAILDAIAKRVVVVDGCWLWPGDRTRKGYARIRTRSGKNLLAHRLSKAADLGAWVPSSMPVHHICAETLCVNPAHLQVVTHHENTAEMMERRAYQERIAHLEAALVALDPSHPLVRRRISPAA